MDWFDVLYQVWALLTAGAVVLERVLKVTRRPVYGVIHLGLTHRQDSDKLAQRSELTDSEQLYDGVRAQRRDPG